MQDSKLVRSVDRYLGSALCNGISLAHALLPDRAQRKNRVIRKILILELFEMGAAVMLIPSIRYLKQKFPDAEIHCLTTTSCLAIWKAIAEIPSAHIHAVESSSPLSLIFSSLQKVLALRKHDFDLLIDYELFMRAPAILSGLLHAKERAGFHKYFMEGLNRGSFYEHRCVYSQNQHISKNYLALTKTAALAAQDMPNFKGAIPYSDVAILPFVARKRELLAGKFGLGTADSPYLALCPDVGKTLPMRNYPRDSFVQLVTRLHSLYPKHKMVFLGTAAERETTKYILGQLGNPDYCLDLCGQTSFEELIQAIACSDLLITNDNGPAHFATLTGTKTLTMFSTDSPFVYGPLGTALIAYSNYHCSPCISAFNHKTSHCNDNRCLQEISVDHLLSLSKALLDGSAKPRTINNQLPYV